MALAGLTAFTLAAVCAPVSMSLLAYIQQTWKQLTRSNQNLASSAVDPKFKPLSDGRWPVYVAKNDFSRAAEELRSQLQPADLQKVVLRQLADDPAHIPEPGLLYLPRPYVVPGGRFNEMYGWDSFFIQMGLLRDGEFGLAKDLADNCLYEIREYGKILNANRTYYLTRSQPPFLTQMLLAVYKHTHDQHWLEDAMPAIETYYRYWTSEPHLTPETGLSRYFDLGDGPAPEVLASEHDARGRTDYDLVREFFRKHKITDYDASQYYDAAKDQLTPLFYKGDRSMRESGFDPSSRFGPFSAEIIHYNPVCLNSLLYLMETQTAEILGLLHRESDAAAWRQRASLRAEKVNRLMWDARDGLYYDYNFAQGHIRRYPFLTTFYPLWAGIASPDQAALVARNVVRFERAGGLQTSEFRSGDQWDAPFGWAPLEWIAVQGLRRYGYLQEAERISHRFLSMVTQQYAKTGTLEEKYDVAKRSAAVGSALRYGYRTNEAGFGWTNSVFTSLFDELSPDQQRNVLAGR
ncbi:MAG TPA: trehalase family glycosidase [Bryobacteraceae bacterium]|nr:trehalase family glycosidase [Bryobacteraceae bacterium]